MSDWFTSTPSSLERSPNIVGDHNMPCSKPVFPNLLCRRDDVCDTVLVKSCKLKVLDEVSRTSPLNAGMRAEGQGGAGTHLSPADSPFVCPLPHEEGAGEGVATTVGLQRRNQEITKNLAATLAPLPKISSLCASRWLPV